jgi:N,N'-diacetyllegionaminate synthase
MMEIAKPVFIIAEAGVNHNGSFEKAIEMIQVAKEANADAVKFQTAVPELVITKNAVKADYQLQFTEKHETQLEMLKKIHLPLESYEILKVECEKLDIEFMSTPFDDVSIETLRKLNLKRYKIPSGEITNLPYLRHVGRIGKPVVMSTGMATLEEVRDALDILLEAGAEKNKITVLHCNTEYPTPMEDVNLRAMLTMRDELGVAVGYSDHTLGIEIPVAAVALGASVIEKHFTLDRDMPGPDHQVSLEPDELKEMVTAIRNIEQAMGDGVKKPSPSEIKNMLIARKSIVAKNPIKKGEAFSEDNLTVKRPWTGISPMEWDNIIAKVANRDYKIDELIKL